MCVPYVNAVVEPFFEVQMTEESREVVSYSKPFDSLTLFKGDHEYPVLPGFKVVTKLNILGTAKPDKIPMNVLAHQGVLEFQLNLTKCADEVGDRKTAVLDAFVIDFRDSEHLKLSKACFDYLNFSRITDVPTSEMTAGSGEYVLKLFARERPQEGEPDAPFTIQSMAPLHISV